MRHSSVYSRQPSVPKMPDGLVELMEGLTKDVLKHNPPDVYQFCANHMKKLLEIRDGPLNIKAMPLDRKIKTAQQIIRKRSEKYWHNKNDVSEAIIAQKAINPVHHELDLKNASEVEISCPPDLTPITAENNDKPEEKEKIEQEKMNQTVSEALNNYISPAESEINPKIEEIIKKDVAEDTLISNDLSVVDINESNVSNPIINMPPVAPVSHSNNLVNMDENLEQTMDQNFIDISEKSVSHIVNTKDEIIDIQNNKTVDKNEDESNSFQNEVIIKYTETVEDAENNSGVEIYVTDDSENQIQIDDAVLTDNEKLEQREQSMTEISQDKNLTINAQNTLDTTKIVGDDIIDEKVVSNTEIGSENSSLNTDKEEEKINGKESVSNVQENIVKSEEESETVRQLNVETLNFDTNADHNIENLNHSQNGDGRDNNTEVAFANEKKETKSENINVNDDIALIKSHILPLSAITQNIRVEEKQNQDAQNPPGESYHMESIAINKDAGPISKDKLFEVNEKELSEDDASDNSGENFNKKLEMTSHDNLQTEIIAEIRENLEHIVKPKQETTTLENTDAATPLVNSATDENNSINSFVEIGKTDCSDETIQNDSTNNTMDLETAAVTIQKVFRTFLFKSRASTFDESVTEESNLSDDDHDENNKDSRSFMLPTLNKDRRTLGISRMDTVLQTVNEEKSLSLSTDDSSTLSSAATVIQAHVRGYLVRNKLHSGKTASSTNSLINSDGPSTTSLEGDGDQHKSKTILNIHIVPEGNNFLSRDESMITSMDLSLDGSPPSSVNLHPLSYDKISERRKQLKREDAIQSVSPPSNNSGKLSEDVESVKELQSNSGSLANVSLEQETAAAITTNDEINQDSKKDSLDTTPTNSITVETVIETNNKSNTAVSTIPEPVLDASDKTKKGLIKQSSDEMDVVTPYKGNTPRDSEASSGLLHSGEFHDTVLPTKVSRSDTPVVSEFKNVLVYFLLWNKS